VSEYNGKVHGSQRDRDPKTGLLDLLVIDNLIKDIAKNPGSRNYK